MTGVGCLECKSMIEERSPQKHSVPLCQLVGANKTDEITVKLHPRPQSCSTVWESSHAGPEPGAGHQLGVEGAAELL